MSIVTQNAFIHSNGGTPADASYAMPPHFTISEAPAGLIQAPRRGFALVGLLVGLVLVLCGVIGWLVGSSQPMPRPMLLGLVAGIAVLAVIAFILGLSSTRRARALLQEAERSRQALNSTLPQLRALWEKAPLSIMLFEPNDPQVPVKIVDCNPMACATHGYRREELIGQCIDLLEARPWTADAAGWIAELRQHRRLEGEGQHKRKDGSIFDIEYFTSLIVVDGRELVIGMDRDATARKAAESALRASEERWQLAVAGSNEGVWDWNIATDGIWFSTR